MGLVAKRPSKQALAVERRLRRAVFLLAFYGCPMIRSNLTSEKGRIDTRRCRSSFHTFLT